MQFAFFHQFCQCDFGKKTQVWHRKWNWIRPNGWASHTKCNALSENVETVSCLPRKIISDMSPNMFTCQEVPPMPRTWHVNPPKMNLLVKLPRGTGLKTVANGREGMRIAANACERLRKVGQHSAKTLWPPHPQNEKERLGRHSGPKGDRLFFCMGDVLKCPRTNIFPNFILFCRWSKKTTIVWPQQWKLQPQLQIKKAILLYKHYTQVGQHPYHFFEW